MKTIFNFFIFSIFIFLSANSCAQSKSLSIKYFENIDFSNLKEEYVQKTVQINNEKIDIDISFNNKNPSSKDLEKLSDFLNKLEFILKENDIKMKNYFDNSEQENNVKEYLTHHLKEMPKAELSTLIRSDDTNKSNEQKLFEKLRLKRIGIIPQEKFDFAIFDYTIGEEYTQYILCIKTDEKGKIQVITIES